MPDGNRGTGGPGEGNHGLVRPDYWMNPTVCRATALAEQTQPPPLGPRVIQALPHNIMNPEVTEPGSHYFGARRLLVLSLAGLLAAEFAGISVSGTDSAEVVGLKIG